MSELKRCPFCGGQAKTRQHEYLGEVFYWEECTICNCRTGIHSIKEVVKEMWNLRTSEPIRTPEEEGLAILKAIECCVKGNCEECPMLTECKVNRNYLKKGVVQNIEQQSVSSKIDSILMVAADIRKEKGIGEDDT